MKSEKSWLAGFVPLLLGFGTWGILTLLIAGAVERRFGVPRALTATVALGLSYAGVSAPWPTWFASHPAALRLSKRFGERRARLIYVGLGVVIAVAGLFGIQFVALK